MASSARLNPAGGSADAEDSDSCLQRVSSAEMNFDGRVSREPQPDAFNWLQRTGFTNQFTKNKALADVITKGAVFKGPSLNPLPFGPNMEFSFWDPFLNARTGRSAAGVVEVS